MEELLQEDVVTAAKADRIGDCRDRPRITDQEVPTRRRCTAGLAARDAIARHIVGFGRRGIGRRLVGVYADDREIVVDPGPHAAFRQGLEQVVPHHRAKGRTMEVTERQHDRASTEETAEPHGAPIRFAEAGPGR